MGIRKRADRRVRRERADKIICRHTHTLRRHCEELDSQRRSNLCTFVGRLFLRLIDGTEIAMNHSQ